MTSDNSTPQMNKLEAEFNAIEEKNLWPFIFHKIKDASMNNQFTTDEAKKWNNKNLNRYRDVNPYDHSRVVLSKEEFNYINASYITVEEANRKYILTQGPLSNTIVHFWLMIWEQNSKAIIMLNKLIEKNQQKCSQYWPDCIIDKEGENALELPQVDLRVELISEKKYSDYVIRNLRLTNTETQQSRDISQYHYITWPDFGVPSSPLAFLKFLRDIRQNGAFDDSYGPPIVHCSAGIGRSGTFCLVDSCLILANENGIENVKVTDILLKMRTFRVGLIQTHDQLKFSYIALLQGLKVDWNASNDDGLPDENYSYVKGNESEEDTPPPLPPPRNTSMGDRPLPGSPDHSSDSSADIIEEINSDSDSDNTDDDSDISVPEINQYEDDKEADVNRSLDAITNSSPTKPSPGLPESRKRKYSETKDKSQRIYDKLQEMKKKQGDAEKWKKQRSILINLTLGASVVAISGVVIAYFWYGKNA